ncbi:STM3941 family protein [Aquimarina algiphila]|uniref:STM3941 family protein n=2 Tax=Aquimarina algiphila TaxID=2047982 RepID=UPI00232B1C18|nr:STM3941 family protein [Aquimarina algiphila]
MKDKIEIELSKKKIFLLLIGALVFVILGVLFIMSPGLFASGFFRNSEIVRIIGIVAVGFFGLCLGFAVKKLFDNKMGLIIDQNGITDHTNATSVGLIEWNDITGIETVQIASTKILMLLTDQPDKYIERAKNTLSKRALKANHKMYGSPLSITSNSLKIKYDDLEKLISSELKKRKKIEDHNNI